MMLKPLIFCLIVLLAQGGAFGAAIYALKDPGSFGGDTFGMAINDHGDVVGYADFGTEQRAFLYENNNPGMQNLGTLGSGNSLAFDINNNGHIVGQTGARSFRYTSSTGMVEIDGANSGQANDLNELDEIIGTRSLPSSDRTVHWSLSDPITNPYPTVSTRGVALNDTGQFVGSTSSGTLGYYGSSLASPRIGLGTFVPTDINNSRLIAGSVGSDAASIDFDSSTSTIIGKLSPTDSGARALGVNETGDVVGESVGTGGFLITNSMGLQNLTSPLASQYSGWTILSAEDINNNGWIVGTGLTPRGQPRAVILQPIPAPAGDFDGDGDRDGQDFLRWQRGESPNPFSDEDLAAWQTCYGTITSGSFTAVPEPGAVLLLSVVLLGVLCRRHSS